MISPRNAYRAIPELAPALVAVSECPPTELRKLQIQQPTVIILELNEEGVPVGGQAAMMSWPDEAQLMMRHAIKVTAKDPRERVMQKRMQAEFSIGALLRLDDAMREGRADSVKHRSLIGGAVLDAVKAHIDVLSRHRPYHWADDKPNWRPAAYREDDAFAEHITDHAERYAVLLGMLGRFQAARYARTFHAASGIRF
jgi:hypothetical protein